MVKIKLNKTLRNTIIAVVAIVLVFALISLLPDKGFSEKYEGVDLTSSTGTVYNYKTYVEYLDEYSKVAHPDINVGFDILDYVEEKSTGIKKENNYYGKNVLITNDVSSVTWSFEVPQEGIYNIQIEYIAIPSRNVSMERILYINGEVPFSGADNLVFYREWKDGGPIKEDNRGNHIRPSQKEFFDFQTVLFKSDLGYEVDPYCFYFKQGINTITLESTNEPMAISSITLVPIEKYDTYSEYLAKQKTKPEEDKSSGVNIILQGEESTVRSDPSLFARYDRTSAITQPYSVKKTVLNYTGGDSWKSPGQWISWDFEVPSDGWYTISVKGRQLYQRGYVACRSVYIDGKIPIDELKSVGFDYSSDWVLKTLSDSNNVPYKFYLTKGKHSIKLEATLGDIGNVIRDLQDCIFRLNLAYRNILVLTGTNPDQYRDYEIDKVYPQTYESLNMESKRLYALIDKFVSITGQKSNQIAPAETLAVQLEQFYKHPDKITAAFQNFKDNVTSLGSSLLAMTETKLDVDYILIQSANDKIKKDKSNFFKNVKHEVLSFIYSFFVDSENIGNVYDKGDDVIDVWIVSGRDNVQILKNMIDDTYTPNSGIKVNVKLIVADSLLQAVVAGNGPDVVLSIYSTLPVDYALRNANVNLMRFDDCKEVLKQFMPSAIEPYKYDGGLYALPEQQTFNLLFYRKDILEELGLTIPNTWDELIQMLPTLQGNNLTAGIPYPLLLNPDMSAIYSMIYQRGGTIYNENGTKSLIDSEEGIQAFKMYTSFYNSYGLPTIFDFLNRFRTGEMPIGIANYNQYNVLAVSAPEIRGLWDFTYLPGTIRDGKLDRTSVSGGNCCVIIKKGQTLEDIAGKESSVDSRTLNKINKNEIRIQKSWDFIKWWVSTETQVRYGREQEAVLGASARYTTANVEALKQLSWNAKQIELLENSLKETVGVPEVPGSYYTPRHVVNGSRKVINEKQDARETLIDYTRKINEEITRKRQEFNLPTE